MLTPIDYGLDPNTITKSCLVGAYEEAPRTLCDDPDKYIFWDEYHVRPGLSTSNLLLIC